MQIMFHAHHAVISENMRQRTEGDLRKLDGRIAHAVDAVVRFEQDGPVRRVEVVLHAPRRRPVIAEGQGRNYGPALAEAVARLEAQLHRIKRTPKARARSLSRT